MELKNCEFLFKLRRPQCDRKKKCGSAREGLGPSRPFSIVRWSKCILLLRLFDFIYPMPCVFFVFIIVCTVLPRYADARYITNASVHIF